MTMTRRDHLDQEFNSFAYLQLHLNSKSVMNHECMYLRECCKGIFKNNAEWLQFYGSVEKEIPVGAPFPYSKQVNSNTWVNADNSGYYLTHFSQTGVLVFINPPPNVWYSKRQSAIYLSKFGFKVVEMYTCPKEALLQAEYYGGAY